MELETVLLWAFALLCVWWLGMIVHDWWCHLAVGPDPWDAIITEQLQDPASVPVCHHCFTPQEHDRWFCPECGRAVGPHNNLMPFISIFSVGEVARSAAYDHLRPTPLIIIGYTVFGVYEYVVFAPLFWFWFARNLRRWLAPQPPEAEVENQS